MDDHRKRFGRRAFLVATAKAGAAVTFCATVGGTVLAACASEPRGPLAPDDLDDNGCGYGYGYGYGYGCGYGYGYGYGP